MTVVLYRNIRAIIKITRINGNEQSPNRVKIHSKARNTKFHQCLMPWLLSEGWT